MKKKEFQKLSNEILKLFQQSKGKIKTNYKSEDISKILMWKKIILGEHIKGMIKRKNSSKEFTVMPPSKKHIEERINDEIDRIKKLRYIERLIIGDVKFNKNKMKEIYEKVEKVIIDVEFQINTLKERSKK